MSGTKAQDTETRPATGTRLIILGVALLAVGNLWVIPFDPGAVFFSAPGIVIAGLAAFLARRFGTWAKVVSLAIGLLLLLMTATFGQLGMFASVFDFVPAMAGLICGLLMVVGSAAALMARGGRPSALDGREQAVFGGAVAVAAVLAAVSGVLSFTADRTVDEADRVGTIEIAVDAFAFPEEAIAIPAGETTRVLLRNDDKYFHTITSVELGFDERLNPGDEVLVEVTPADTGTFQLWCRPHAREDDEGVWDGMVGMVSIH